MKKLVFLTAACAAAMIAEADVRLAPVFGDKMVLQREMPVRVWGFADPRETVTVRFADQKKTVVAEDDGTWRITDDAAGRERTRAKGDYSQNGGSFKGSMVNPGVGDGEIEGSVKDGAMTFDFIEHWHTPYKHNVYSGVKL